MKNLRFTILTTMALLVSSSALLLTSCDGGNDEDPKPKMEATSMELVSGGNQSAFIEEALENAIEIIVKDQDGNAFEGAIVSFAVTEGSVSTASATTDITGKVNVTWTLGTTEGAQTLTVTGVGTPINVTATALRLPVIGDFYEGGVVFYIDETGKHGLVCAVTDQSTGAEWGCSGTTIDGADGIEIGTGQQNTLDILAGCTTEGTAADLCDKLELNGYDDWFLPSKDELNLIYQNKTIINTNSIENNGVAVENTVYWTSSEGASSIAWTQSMDINAQNGNTKTVLNNVRAIRSF